MSGKGSKPRVSHLLDHDEVERLYATGLSAREVAERQPVEVSEYTIRSILRARGAMRSQSQTVADRNRARTLPSPARDELRQMYETDGLPACQIADQYGVSEGTVRNWLVAAQIELRDRGDAFRNRLSRMSPAERSASQSAASLSRTSASLHSSKVAIAAAKEARYSHVGMWEPEIQSMLASRGLNARPQLQIGWFNADLALAPVSVEIHRNRSHPFGAAWRDRLTYLSGRGWLCWYIWLKPTESPKPAAIDTLAQLYRSLLAGDEGSAKHRVIRGDGQVVDHRVTRRGMKNPRRSPNGTKRHTDYDVPPVLPYADLAWTA